MTSVGALVDKAISSEIQLVIQKYEQEIESLKIKQSGADNLDWFMKLTLIPRDLVTAVLYQFRDELEGSLVTYSKGKGSPWKFNKFLVTQWYTENFERVEQAVELARNTRN